MTKLRQLIESALKDKEIIKEDGTIADLGAIPTGHIINDKDDDNVEEIE